MAPERRVRASPLQPRGKHSVGKMLDATGELLSEAGYEHLTTQAVARRSGVSIGLVYHYFPDRLALVEALVERNSARFMSRVWERIDAEQTSTWRAALTVVLDVLADMYRYEPGFFQVGLNDQFLTKDHEPRGADRAQLAKAFLDLYCERFGGAGPEAGGPAAGGPEAGGLALRFEVAVEIADALMSRAFRDDRSGDPAVLAESRRLVEGYLAPFLDQPSPAAGPSAAAGD